MLLRPPARLNLRQSRSRQAPTIADQEYQFPRQGALVHRERHAHLVLGREAGILEAEGAARSGWTPTPSQSRPVLGTNPRALGRNTTNPSATGVQPPTCAAPAVRSPTTRPRPVCCSAKASASAAEPVPLSTSR